MNKNFFYSTYINSKTTSIIAVKKAIPLFSKSNASYSPWVNYCYVDWILNALDQFSPVSTIEISEITPLSGVFAWELFQVSLTSIKIMTEIVEGRGSQIVWRSTGLLGLTNASFQPEGVLSKVSLAQLQQT